MNETDKALQNAQPYEPSIEEQEIRTQAKGYKIMKVVDAIKMDMPKPPMIVEDISNKWANFGFHFQEVGHWGCTAKQVSCLETAGKRVRDVWVTQPNKYFVSSCTATKSAIVRLHAITHHWCYILQMSFVLG